ncbi:hypothetical protein HPB51_025969 [Rhipicephalus microplus]|uniref:Uncharacterized protein n=1 Tax=Rhipicephalus microplus TaxID=6941 RepID=A0A9J6EDU5_RHIMP|nr:hypothetical protein HPB51_025969 [Rhipicephalus microplus]
MNNDRLITIIVIIAATTASACGVNRVLKLGRWRSKAGGGVLPEVMCAYEEVQAELNVLPFCSQFIPMEVPPLGPLDTQLRSVWKCIVSAAANVNVPDTWTGRTFSCVSMELCCNGRQAVAYRIQHVAVARRSTGIQKEKAVHSKKTPKMFV